MVREAIARLLQHAGQHAQIVLGRRQIAMAEVRREPRQPRVHILARAIPRQHAVRGEGMPLMPKSA